MTTQIVAHSLNNRSQPQGITLKQAMTTASSEPNETIMSEPQGITLKQAMTTRRILDL